MSAVDPGVPPFTPSVAGVAISLLELEADVVEAPGSAPAFFADVGLDHVVERMLAGRERYRLEPFLYRRLSSRETVEFRQTIFRDLEDTSLLDRLRVFSERMTAMRRDLDRAGRLRFELQRQGSFLSAAGTYCAAVEGFTQDLRDAGVRSAGLRRLLRHLDDYRASPGFIRLEQECGEVERALREIVYCLDLGHRDVQVTRFEGQADSAEQLTLTFGRFLSDGRAPAAVPHDASPDLDLVEVMILTRVATLFPRPFAILEDFCREHQEFPDPALRDVERQAQFYLAYLDYIRPLTQAGLPFCYPRVSTSKDIRVEAAFDLALATEAVGRGRQVVTNDVSLHGGERVLVVTGPNQGGKTTFARMFAQLHHLAALGCPVPGTAARLLLPDQILTHFDRQEDLSDLRGKLEDDLVRIRDLLLGATSQSILVANEAFACTSPVDALDLGRQIIQEIIARDLLAVYVTFVDELASIAPEVVSMVATVRPDDPCIRTFRVLRRPADGRAYADAIARRYGLDRAALRERLRR